MFFQLHKKIISVVWLFFAPVVVITNSNLTLDFTATPATPTATANVARLVTAAATRPAATQTTTIKGTHW